MTIAEQLKATGKAEGEAKGRVEGQRALVLKQLALKFGTLDEASRTRVGEASSDELERYAERVLVAPNLAAIFEP